MPVIKIGGPYYVKSDCDAVAPLPKPLQKKRDKLEEQRASALRNTTEQPPQTLRTRILLLPGWGAMLLPLLNVAITIGVLMHTIWQDKFLFISRVSLALCYVAIALALIVAGCKFFRQGRWVAMLVTGISWYLAIAVFHLLYISQWLCLLVAFLTMLLPFAPRQDKSVTSNR